MSAGGRKTKGRPPEETVGCVNESVKKVTQVTEHTDEKVSRDPPAARNRRLKGLPE